MESKPQSNEDIVLTKEQEDKIIEFWNGRKESPPMLKDIIQIAFGGDFDGRSKQGAAVKKFLASRNIRAQAAHEYVSKVSQFKLTEEQKTFIGSNASTMSILDLAKYLFTEKKISPLSVEFLGIKAYLRTLPVSMLYKEQEVIEATYKPPKTLEQTVARVNRYIHNGIELSKISPRQKEEAKALMGYLHSFRFSHCYCAMATDSDRELFESSFLSYTYDKPDLTSEEIDSYINLALDVVNLAITQRQITKLTQLMEDCADDPEEKKISMSLAESIHNAQTEYHQNKTRQQKLVQDLQGKRADRLNNQLRENASILNLVELWKDEKERKNMIRMAQIRQNAIKTEIERLSTIDELKAKIFGISKEELMGFSDDE